MSNALEHKIVLVIRPTRLDELVGRFNTVQQARFYVEHLGADFSDYLAEHSRYHQAVGETEAVLRTFGRIQRLERRYLSNFIFAAEDRIVVLGQDGLVANTMKYLDGQRVIGVNPDPARWDGVLLPFTVKDLPKVMPDEASRKAKSVTMARATLNNGQSLLAVNDFFIGQRSHVSARYRIAVGGAEERQSSSGIIVSTGFGSTGWLRSIYAGLAAVARTRSDKKPDDSSEHHDGAFPWDAQELHYFVREPYPSRTTLTDIVIGMIGVGQQLRVMSEMPENGVVFSDGIEADFLEFNSGSTVTIGTAEQQGLLVV
jgi:NAD kinase